jgi:hypothetical protein
MVLYKSFNILWHTPMGNSLDSFNSSMYSIMFYNSAGLASHDALQRQLMYERERGLMAAGAVSGMLPGSLAASQHLQQQQQRHHEEYLR